MAVRLASKEILVVDDHPERTAIWVKKLRSDDAIIHIAFDLDEALSIIDKKSATLSLALIDIHLPCTIPQRIMSHAIDLPEMHEGRALGLYILKTFNKIKVAYITSFESITIDKDQPDHELMILRPSHIMPKDFLPHVISIMEQ